MRGEPSPQRKLNVLAAVMSSLGHSIQVRYGYSIRKPNVKRTETGVTCPQCGSRHCYVKFTKTKCCNCGHRF